MAHRPRPGRSALGSLAIGLTAGVGVVAGYVVGQLASGLSGWVIAACLGLGAYVTAVSLVGRLFGRGSVRLVYETTAALLYPLLWVLLGVLAVHGALLRAAERVAVIPAPAPHSKQAGQ